MYRSLQPTRRVFRIALQHTARFSTAPNPVHLRIVFGSQSGTAEAFANELEFDAQEANVSAEIIDALKFTPEELAKRKDGKPTVNAFVMACYGEGEPTDNAKKFIHQLDTKEGNNKFAGTKYAVFGLGNSQCFRDRFNVVGKRLDQKLEDLGAQRVIPLGLGDASPELTGSETMGERFISWKQSLLKEIQNMDRPISSVETDSEEIKPQVVTSQEVSEETITPTMKPMFTPPSHTAPALALSARQRAMIPANRMILKSNVSHVTQLFSRTDEFTAAVEVEFDLTKTHPLSANPITSTASSFQNLTHALQPGDHIGVFAPNSRAVVERFALAAGLTPEQLDAQAPNEDEPVSLRQVLTWQSHLTGVASSTSIKLLQRWLKDLPGLPQTAKLFAQLESKYDTLVRDKGLDTATVLDMIPKLPGVQLPIPALLKTLPTLNPRLYSITHMVLPSEKDAASLAKANACPIKAALAAKEQQQKKVMYVQSPTAVDDHTKITLLCRLLRYRQTKSSANRVVEGVCSSYLTERLVEGNSDVAIFFRESNFHLPKPTPLTTGTTEIPPPVIMIAGGSGLAPFMSFLEERERILHKPHLTMGPAVLYFGCRTNEEYMFREKLASYLNANSNNVSKKGQAVLDRLVTSFSTHYEGETIDNIEPLHRNEVIHPVEAHIPSVFKQDRGYFLDWIKKGGYIYVCGGAGQFGKAVREAVNEIVMEAYNIPDKDDQGREIIHPGIRYLIQSKRYFEDLAD